MTNCCGGTVGGKGEEVKGTPWLAQARDIAVVANNVVYTLEDQTIWRYDGVRSQLVDLSSLGTVNDIEVALGKGKGDATLY